MILGKIWYNLVFPWMDKKSVSKTYHSTKSMHTALFCKSTAEKTIVYFQMSDFPKTVTPFTP